MALKLSEIPQTIRAPLQGAIEDQIRQIIEEETSVAQKRVADRIRSSVGSIACRVLEQLHFDRVGQDLIIRVEFAFPKP